MLIIYKNPYQDRALLLMKCKPKASVPNDAPATSIEDLLVNGIEEREVGDSPYLFEGGDNAIVTDVQREEAVAWGEIVEVGSDSEDDEVTVPCMSRTAMLNLCQQLKACCLEVDANCSFELSRNLHRFRAHVRLAELREAKQTTLTSLWAKGN